MVRRWTVPTALASVLRWRSTRLNQSNTAAARDIISDGGLTVGATQVADEESDHGAVATSGAGGSNVGVAGSVGVNVVSNKSLATYESGLVSGVREVDIDASNKSNSVTKAGATIEGEGRQRGCRRGRCDRCCRQPDRRDDRQ